MGRRGYPAEFRHRAIALVDAGRRIKDLSEDLGLSEQPLYTWRRQARIDRGDEPGLTTRERAELVAMRRRLRELEAELTVHRRATELLRGDVYRKPDTQPSK
jgi:transposase-like protein